MGQAAKLHAGLARSVCGRPLSGLHPARSPLSVSALWSRCVVPPWAAVSTRSHLVDVLLVAGRDERIRTDVEDRGACARLMAKAEESRAAAGNEISFPHSLVRIAHGPESRAVPA